MKKGTVNADKVVGIANRLRIATKSERAKVLAELIAAIDEEGAPAPLRKPSDGELAPSNIVALRDMLQWPEIRNDALATARITRIIISERDK